MGRVWNESCLHKINNVLWQGNYVPTKETEKSYRLLQNTCPFLLICLSIALSYLTNRRLTGEKKMAGKNNGRICESYNTLSVVIIVVSWILWNQALKVYKLDFPCSPLMPAMPLSVMSCARIKKIKRTNISSTFSKHSCLKYQPVTTRLRRTVLQWYV